MDAGCRIGLVVLGLIACGDPPASADTGGGSTSTGAAASGSASTTEPPGPKEDVGSASFLPPGPDPSPFECSVWTQGCPPGEKCVPWNPDGGPEWTATRCRPVTEQADRPGEPCTVEERPTSGIDSCDINSMCWHVDPSTLTGVCRAFCRGGESNPMCDPGYQCPISASYSLALCLPECNPLESDCGPGLACESLAGNWLCFDGGGDGSVGTPCETGSPGLGTCDEETTCVGAAAVPGCTGSRGCCSKLCRLDNPDPGCLPAQVCSPWFEVGTAPPEYEQLGVCIIPQ